jgi:hypothetical protein
MRLPAEFDLHGLEVFVLTVELGGMTACAQQLRITQSAVSQTITRLEQGIGAPLFDRSLRPLGLTPRAAPCTNARASCWPMPAPPMTKCAKARSSRSTS